MVSIRNIGSANRRASHPRGQCRSLHRGLPLGIDTTAGERSPAAARIAKPCGQGRAACCDVLPPDHRQASSSYQGRESSTESRFRCRRNRWKVSRRSSTAVGRASTWRWPTTASARKANSRDFLIRAYYIESALQDAGAQGGSGTVDVNGFVSFRDP